MTIAEQSQPYWHELESLAITAKQQKLTDLFKDNSQRAQNYCLQVSDVFLDYSKNLVDDTILALLFKLADSSDLKIKIQKLFKGDHVNHSEDRPALHMALRNNKPGKFIVAGKDILADINSQKDKMREFVGQLHAGKLGYTGQKIQHVVNIGIGGSDLGPVMTTTALAEFATNKLELHFVSNIDPTAIDRVINKLDPATTIFIVSSKSFTTLETLENAKIAKHWLTAALGEKAVRGHMFAVTSKVTAAKEFGIDANNIFQFWDWVGGRFSIWSSIGLPLAIAIGMENFDRFLQGAHNMDEHFANAPWAENMPVILALLGIWYINFFDANSLAILPYEDKLQHLPAYLQQLDMESNGKSLNINQQHLAYKTAPIIWGQVGTNGQHAFYQLLHQGSHFIPIDFIAVANTNSPNKAQHKMLLANCFAQAQSLMQGDSTANISGNKVSNSILLKSLTPESLGALLALYEHKTFVQGAIWNINSFDQPGVELGKKLAVKLMDSLQKPDLLSDLDPSTLQLVKLASQLQD